MAIYSISLKVKYQGAMTDQFECNIGVRQGESISPFLFNIFFNDLDSALALGGCQGITEGAFNLRSLMYAYDVLLLSNSREELEAGLDCFYDYCLKWKLHVNTTKTSIITFRKGGTTSLDDHFFFGDKLLTISISLSYLGLVLSCSDRFSQTQSNLADRGLKVVYKLFNDTHELYAPDPNFLCSLFDKLVQPVVLYGSEVWGFHSALDVERVQLSFFKRVLHVKRSTAN